MRRLHLVPPAQPPTRQLVLTYACLTAEQRGADVEPLPAGDETSRLHELADRLRASGWGCG